MLMPQRKWNHHLERNKIFFYCKLLVNVLPSSVSHYKKIPKKNLVYLM